MSVFHSYRCCLAVTMNSYFVSFFVFSIFICNKVFGEVTYTACQDGWIPYEGSCYLFGIDRKTHADAQQFCQQQSSAHLVHVNNERENNFIKDWLHIYMQGGWWLGLSDTDQEGTFVWTDKSTPTFTDWHPGQPDNYGIGEDCVNFHLNYDFEWGDTICTYKYHPICETTGQAYQVSS